MDGIRPTTLADLGYEGPLVTQCSRVVDEVLFVMMKKRATDTSMIMACIAGLKDRIFVFETQEILTESSDCFCAAQLVLKNGTVVLAVPWLRQYEDGACLSVYRKGAVDDFEIEAILAQLIEQLEFATAPNAQQHLM